MKLSLAFLILLGCFSFLWIPPKKEGFAFEIELKNGGSFEVFEVKNEMGGLEKYTANIQAPVCEEGVCYPISLIFNWNLIGEFMNYEMIDGEPLTKLDHVPFLPKDYEKLQLILTDKDLSFVKIPAEELVVKTPKDSVDGYSGATKETIKKEIIEGALYTCYTLWHIAHGAVVDSIEQHTLKKLDKVLIEQVAKLRKQSANYFLINHLTDKQFEENTGVVLTLIKEGKGYFSKNAIEKMPSSVFQKNQAFIIAHYPHFDYYTQLALLNKLNSVVLNEPLESLLIENLSSRNSALNQKITTLILKTTHQLILEKLVDQLIQKKIALTTTAYQQLESLSGSFRDKIKEIEKVN
ncbi:MAG: hypothetical protein R2822_31030 [Spirosomataceae bacterium]